MRTETVTYEADGLQMQSQLVWDDSRSGPRPAVLVYPALFGLDDHTRERAERLVSEFGYVALACDIHGDAKYYADMQEVMGLMAPVRESPARIRARARGAFDVLRARPEVDPARIGAIGFCFGGTMALELARGGGEVAAVVGFHCGLATKAPPEDAKAIRGKVLVCIGADDPGVPAEQRQGFETEMRAAGVNWQMSVYGGVVHSFTEKNADRLGRPDFVRYDAQADARSWREMGMVFHEVFGEA